MVRPENTARTTKRHTDRPILARSALIFHSTNYTNRRTTAILKKTGKYGLKVRRKSGVSTQQHPIDCCVFLKKRIDDLGVNRLTCDYLCDAWMPNMLKTYGVF